MFDQTLAVPTRSRAAIPLAYVCEVLLIGGLVLIPLVRTDGLSLVEMRNRWSFLPSVPPAPRGARPDASERRKTTRPVSGAQLQVPPVIPDTIQQIADETTMPTTAAPELPGVPWGLEARSTDSVLTGLLAGLPAHSPPLPPSSLPRTGRPGRLRISHVDPAKLIFQPKPNYPPLALATRVQGTVRLEAIINRNGQIGELRVLSGHPLLVRAALDAVSRWRYQPTLLNGEPVEVVTEIEVRFSLGE